MTDPTPAAADPAAAPPAPEGPARPTADATKGILLMILAMFLFATLDAGSKILVADHSVWQIIWVRYLFFAAMAVALARAALPRPRPALPPLKSNRPLTQIARGVILVAEVGCFVLAFRYLGLGEAHAIAAVAPLIVTALSAPFLGESVGPRRWAAVLVGFLGVLIILRPGLGVFDPAALLPLAGATLLAIYQILTRRVAGHDGAMTSLLYTGLAGLAITSLIGPAVWTAPSATGWAVLIGVGVLGTFAHLTLIKALEAAPASTIQPFHYMLFLWAVVMGAAIFGEWPDLATLVGGAVVTASGLYVWARERRLKA